jgi:DNA repair and recombination protein RAD52
MMSFTAKQRQALTAKLDSRAIKERQQSGQTFRYIEGWYAIAEANRLFGHDGTVRP